MMFLTIRQFLLLLEMVGVVVDHNYSEWCPRRRTGDVGYRGGVAGELRDWPLVADAPQWACIPADRSMRSFGAAMYDGRKYYASVMRIKEFYEDNIGRSFTGIIADFARRCNCHK